MRLFRTRYFPVLIFTITTASTRYYLFPCFFLQTAYDLWEREAFAIISLKAFIQSVAGKVFEYLCF